MEPSASNTAPPPLFTPANSFGRRKWLRAIRIEATTTCFEKSLLPTSTSRYEFGMIELPVPPKKTFAEFFAGVGLMRIGLERGGWQIASANDICR
jgi:hypothetical protein